MSLASRWGRVAASLAVIGVLAFGVVLSGCSQAPAPEPEESPAPDSGPAPGPNEPAGDPDPKPLPHPEPEHLADPGPQPKPEAEPDSAGSSAAAKVSAFAPAEDLAAQVPEYIKDLEEAVASQEDYQDFAEKISKDSNALILIALALGMHDQDNKYKAAAGGLVKAAQELANAKDFVSARKGVAAVKKAAEAQSPPPTKLKWERVASLPETMKKVPLINTKLKSALRRIEKRAKDARGHAAVLAVIAHGSMANAGDTHKPDQVQKWHEYCVEMRQAAMAVNAAIRAMDKEAITAGMARLQQSCETCHEVFHPEEEE